LGRQAAATEGSSDVTDRINKQRHNSVVPLKDHADLGDTDDRPDPVAILSRF